MAVGFPVLPGKVQRIVKAAKSSHLSNGVILAMLQHGPGLLFLGLGDGAAVDMFKHEIPQGMVGPVDILRHQNLPRPAGGFDDVADHGIDALLVKIPEAFPQILRNVGIGQNPRPDGIVDVVVDVGDLVGMADDPGLQGFRLPFARVGQKPGKTIHINYFKVDDRAYFVDLPGYGYAQVAASEKERWGKLMEAYFAEGEEITLGVMIVDARHAPTKLDIVMAQLFRDTGCPFLVVANKLDKLKPKEIEPNMQVIRKDLGLSPETLLIPFSAEKGTGRGELVNAIFAATKGKASV